MAKLKRQIYNELGKMKAYGEKRHEAKEKAKAEGKDRNFYTKNKIYSEKTFNIYVQYCQRLREYAEKQNPNIKTLDELKNYVEPFLNEKIDDGLSAWSISSYLAGFNKLFQTEKEDYKNLKSYKRDVEDITKNRGDKKLKYNPKNYENELRFSRCLGLRVSELRDLSLNDIYIKNNKIESVFVRQGKGGKQRYVKFYGSREEEQQIIKDIEEKRAKGYKKAFPAFTNELKIHRERQEYAKRVYNHHSRDVSTLPREDVTTPRKGANKGHKYDKKALEITSKMLGHTRINVVYQNYLSA